jgi:hypothetical protein
LKGQRNGPVWFTPSLATARCAAAVVCRGIVWSALHFWDAVAAPQAHKLFRPPSHAKAVADISSPLRCTLGAATAAAGRVLTAAK